VVSVLAQHDCFSADVYAAALKEYAPLAKTSKSPKACLFPALDPAGSRALSRLFSWRPLDDALSAQLVWGAVNFLQTRPDADAAAAAAAAREVDDEWLDLFLPILLVRARGRARRGRAGLTRGQHSLPLPRQQEIYDKVCQALFRQQPAASLPHTHLAALARFAVELHLLLRPPSEVRQKLMDVLFGVLRETWVTGARASLSDKLVDQLEVLGRIPDADTMPLLQCVGAGGGALADAAAGGPCASPRTCGCWPRRRRRQWASPTR
jgi:hypothetical protein